MSTDTLAPPEVLIARKTLWRKRLWVRVFSLLLMMVLILLVLWWWPRRGMVEVWRVGGYAGGESDYERTLEVFRTLNPAEVGEQWIDFDRLSLVVTASRTDQEITGVNLISSQVDDRWLTELRRFPNLKFVGVNDRQLGSGIAELQEHGKLARLDIDSASKDHLKYCRSLPQLRAVSLWSPVASSLELDVLADLSNLRTLFVADATGTGKLLAQLPALPQVEKLILQNCQHVSDSDLDHLDKLPNLKTLHLTSTGSIHGDTVKKLIERRNLRSVYLYRSTLPMTDDLKQFLRKASPDISLQILD